MSAVFAGDGRRRVRHLLRPATGGGWRPSGAAQTPSLAAAQVGESAYDRARSGLLTQLERMTRAVRDVDHFDGDGFGAPAIERMRVVRADLTAAVAAYELAIDRLVPDLAPSPPAGPAGAFRVGDDFGWECEPCGIDKRGWPAADQVEAVVRAHNTAHLLAGDLLQVLALAERTGGSDV